MHPDSLFFFWLHQDLVAAHGIDRVCGPQRRGCVFVVPREPAVPPPLSRKGRPPPLVLSTGDGSAPDATERRRIRSSGCAWEVKTGTWRGGKRGKTSRNVLIDHACRIFSRGPGVQQLCETSAIAILSGSLPPGGDDEVWAHSPCPAPTGCRPC